MKLNAYILLSILVLFAFTGCKKDIDFFRPDHEDFDTTWVNQIPDGAPINFLMKDLAPAIYTDSINISSTSEAALSSGLQCVFKPGSFVDVQNNPISGQVAFSNSMFSKKGDIIRLGLSTETATELIDCSSIASLSFSQNNQPVFLKQGDSIDIHYTVPFNENFTVFYKDTNIWAKATATGNKLQPTPRGYQLRTNNLPWVCVGKLLNPAPQNETYLSVNMPGNYTNTNSVAYLVLKNKNTAIRLIQNVNSHCFYHPGIPSNEEGMVLVVSKQVNDYYLGAVIFNSLEGNETLVKVKPVKKSFNDVMRFLAAL